MLDSAYALLKKKGTPMRFADIWAHVKEEMEITEEEEEHRIGLFYTDLSLSGLFVALENNYWDLRAHQKYEVYHFDATATYEEVSQSDGDKEDQKDEQEYNAAMNGNLVDEETEEDTEEDESTPKRDVSAAELGIKTDE